MHPSLLLRLATQRTYLVGVAFQVAGSLFAFLARGELPLFLVQASVAAGLGVMALLGVVICKWKLPRAEIALLGLLGVGIAALVISAKPGKAHHLSATGVIVLTCVLGVIGLLGVFAARLRGAPGSVALGSLAGLAFGAAAIDSRSLAAAQSWRAFILHPLLYLLLAFAVVGQLLLGMAMQRGSTTAAVAAMDAASTVPAAVIGLAFLGDQIWAGRQWLAAAGFTLTLVAVVALSRFAQPQHGTQASTHIPRVIATAKVPGQRLATENSHKAEISMQCSRIPAPPPAPLGSSLHCDPHSTSGDADVMPRAIVPCEVAEKVGVPATRLRSPTPATGLGSYGHTVN